MSHSNPQDFMREGERLDPAMAQYAYADRGDSLTAEQAVLGALLSESDTLAEVASILDASDFSRQAHQLIYKAIIVAVKSGARGAIIIEASEVLADEAEIDSTGDRRTSLESVGGRSYINDLALSCVTVGNIVWNARQVKNHAIRRRLIDFAAELNYHAQELTGPECLERAQRVLLDIAAGATQHEIKTTEEIFALARKNLEMRARGEIVGASTGFRAVDAVQEGLSPTNLIILAARPGMGKTAYATNVACDIAIRQQLPVVVFTQEMSADQLAMRMLISEAQSKETSRTDQVATPLFLHFEDKSVFTALEIRAAMMRYRQKYDRIGLVVVDYLQLMSGPGDNRAQEVNQIARDLKGIAKDYNLPLMALSQLSRNVESRQDKRPILSDLKESSGIEEAADEIQFLYRDDYYNFESQRPGVCEVIMAKNRDGQIGTIELLWRKEITKFEEANRAW